MLDIVPLSPRLAAEVRGVDLSSLSPEKVLQIRIALQEHLVLVFRGQHLSTAQLSEFACCFGELYRHDYVPGIPQQPDVIEIRKHPEHTQNFGGSWHSDNSYLSTPPLGSVLHAVEIPPTGGDTLWSNQYSAYASLPAELRSAIDLLFAAHSPYPAFGIMTPLESSPIRQLRQDVIHPLIRTHPETKRRSLFHSGLCTVSVVGWEEDRSRQLLDTLLSYATREDITYRHQWRVHDVVFWDNRCTMHIAENDYMGHQRIVRRVSIQGDKPI